MHPLPRHTPCKYIHGYQLQLNTYTHVKDAQKDKHLKRDLMYKQDHIQNTLGIKPKQPVEERMFVPRVEISIVM